MGQAVNILIVKLGSIGDIVHTLPALAALRQRFPGARIDWLVESRSRDILLGNPQVDNLLEVDTLSWRRRLGHFDTWKNIVRSLRALRGCRYDVILDFQGLLKSAVCSFLARGSRRIGFDRGHLRESLARFFTTERLAPGGDHRHVIDRNLYLLTSLGIETRDRSFSIVVPEEMEALAETTLQSWQLADYVALNPGGGWETKRWPPERFGLLATDIRKETGLQSLVLWGPGEKEIAESVVREAAGAARLAPPTELRQMIPYLRRARLFVGGDTGPLHIASALGVPVVGIYGPTDPERNGPAGAADRVVVHSVPCGPCYKRRCPGFDQVCLRSMEEQAVLDAVRLRLAVGREAAV
jgi:lipopolysaccharide heptosyltransferase I